MKGPPAQEQSAYPTNCEVIYNSICTEDAITFLELFKEFKVVSFATYIKIFQYIF